MDQQFSELRLLFHKLNNQLGIILSHAELLEAKSPDPMNRARAGQVITSVLDAMATAKELRQKTVLEPQAGAPSTPPSTVEAAKPLAT